MKPGDIGKDTKDTVVWLGSGFSYGSQDYEPYRPPLGCKFFTASVKERLKRYPVLQAVWEAYKSPQDLEDFWKNLDVDFNQGRCSVEISESGLDKAFKESRRSPAHQGLKDYYEIYSEGVASVVSHAQAVAGFELKCLTQDILRPGPTECRRLRQFWSILRHPLRVLTFNYDLYAEFSLVCDRRGFSYRPSLAPEIADIFKLHGSIQWTHRKFCDRDGKCRFCWANDGECPLGICESLSCEAPRSWFGERCHEKPCFHLIDPVMVGLRQKREFGKGEGDPRIRDLFGGLLRDSQEALIAADRVIVIGFSFSKADDYLWCHLAAKQVGSPKQVLCCYFNQDPDQDYEKRVQEFFGVEATFIRSGFADEFLTRLSSFLK